MSSYYYEEVVRLKLSQNELKKNGIGSKWDLEDKFPNESSESKRGKFEIAPTEGDFLDLVIVGHTGDGGEYGNSRYLTDEEVNKYLPIFKEVVPFARAEDMRYVTFSWYNCSEAPDYFDVPNSNISVKGLFQDLHDKLVEESVTLEDLKHGMRNDKSRRNEVKYIEGRLDENLEVRTLLSAILDELD